MLNRINTSANNHFFPKAEWKRRGPEMQEAILTCKKCGLQKKLQQRLGALEPKIIQIRKKGGEWAVYHQLPACEDRSLIQDAR